MQKRNEGNLPKRTRFYQGLVDAPLLKSGERGFDNLNPLYIVVICDFDLFGYEKYRYTFTNRCHEVTDLELGDAATKIFLNTDGRNKEDVEKNLVDFLSYVRNSTSDMLSPECDARLIDLHNKISRIKSSSEMEVTYMKMEERDRQIREEGVALGISQGISQGIALGQTAAIQSFINTHRNKGTDESEILTLLQEFFNLSKDEASALLNLPQS